MNSEEFISALAKKLNLSKDEAAKRAGYVSGIITNELVKDNTISIAGFGHFEIKKRNERISIHPVTKSRLLIPPKLIVGFKPASGLKDKIKSIEL